MFMFNISRRTCRPFSLGNLLPYRKYSFDIFSNARKHASRTAVLDHSGRYTYQNLLNDSSQLRAQLSNSDLKEGRVSYLCPNDYDYVVSQWAIWQAGGVAVPLCISHTPGELEYTITNSRSAIVLASQELEEKVKPIAEKHGIKFLRVPEQKRQEKGSTLPSIDLEDKRAGLIIYTSGTTGRPKGVVLTHGNFSAMVNSLVKAWEWNPNDHILQILPLHHLHGVLNILTCCLYSGALCEMVHFNANKIWDKIIGEEGVTLFMAVPTIYSKMIEAYNLFDKEKQKLATEKAKKLRLMVSGSSALPEPVFKKWEEVSGHRLLERFGMSELGMALGNPLHPPEARIPGNVGKPFSGVTVKINIIDSDKSDVGELYVKGPQVFKEYFDNPKATSETFSSDGWFKTGDIAQKLEDGSYKILGRASVDIIKSGGYKISALEIEREILGHPEISETAVVGLPDDTWGEIICALVVKKTEKLTEEELLEWLKQHLSGYKMPRKIIFMKDLPRNVMGKVNKKELVKLPIYGNKS